VSGVYLGLGANLGYRRGNIALALRMLPPLVQVEAVSPLYESPPQAPAAGPDYYNAACRVDTGLTPPLLLRHLKRLEHDLGRRPAERWAPRPIDIDILLWDNLVSADPELSLPHPRLAERAFVVRPLLDLDPSLVHPATGEPLSDLLARLGDAPLRLLAQGEWWLGHGGPPV
jgi:GTP cyclohydrolase-4